jgi:type I restriction enzyme R subunit
MTPEQRARAVIDETLHLAGWVIQDRDAINLSASQGVAVREVPMADGGFCDYLLYVDQRIVGVIEAKKDGTTLAEVHAQAMRYAENLTAAQQLNAVRVGGRLPFVYEATSTELFFTNHFDPEPRSRRIFAIQRPETLASFIREADANPEAPTWRGRIHTIPSTDAYDLRPASRAAVLAIENSLQTDSHAKSLVQMATGAGKTRMAVTLSYRLLKFGGFKRVLFLVDRNNLADQTLREFRDWSTPDDGRKYTELYNVDKLTQAGLAESSKVVISTIQRVWAGIKGEPIPEEDDPQFDEYQPDQPVTATYSAALPPETFDLIIVDECHRSIYGLWRNVLEYFDAHVVGLTATPTKQTLGFFEQNLVSEYTYTQSVADGVNVDFTVYRIKTQVTEEGGVIEAGEIIPAIDKRTREQRLEQLDQDLNYSPTDLDRAVVNPNQIRTVLQTFQDRLFTEIFPGRSEVPKTLIFAKNDAHAEDIVRTARQVFGRGDDFAQKITYTAKNAKDLLQKFRNSPELRIAVTVDMIATGTDVKPIECVFFMRDIKSGTYFEQMKGRGARTIDDATFQQVTPDATHKERFVIVDAIGVTEHDFVDVTTLDRNKSISLDKLLQKAANRELTQDDAATLASRLARLNRRLTAAEAKEIQDISGTSLDVITSSLLTVTNPDEIAKVIETVQAQGSDEENLALHDFIQNAATPLAANPALRDRILGFHQNHYLYRDEITPDILLDAHGVVDLGRAKEIVESWTQYLEDNKDEITAIHMLYSTPKGAKVTYQEIEDLIRTIRTPHPEWTPAVIWKAYQELQKTMKSLTNSTADLVSLIRYSLGVTNELRPFAEEVEDRFRNWLAIQKQAGVTFTEKQLWWLHNIKDAIATGITFSIDQLDMSPFNEEGGSAGIVTVFPNAKDIIDQINQELGA